MHGVTMIFLYALPVLSGFSNFLWPLLLGSRDMAFPRLNAFSYWIFLFAGIFLYASFPIGRAPDAGWFNYVPYSSLAYNPGINIDVYALGMILLGVSTTVGSINFIVTLIRTRAPGMSINRVPILDLGHADRVGRQPVRRAGGQPGLLHALDGPPLRHAFLRRRPAAASRCLAAPVLDVRPPVGLRHRAAGDGHRLRRAADLLPPPAGRLHGGRPGDRDDDGARLRRLGAPHVRDRPAAAVAVVLQRRQLRHRHPERGRACSPGWRRSGPAGRSSPRRSCSSPAS